MTEGDESLVAEFLSRRDEEAFRALYRRHSPRLWLVILRLLGGRDAEAQDALQDTWIRAAARLPEFRWEARLSTWLTGIAVNRCREAWRGDRRAPRETELAEEPRAEAAASERLDLERAVRALPDGFRAVLVLHDVEGYTHDEIARLLAIDAGTSKSQLSRARARLRETLGPARAVGKVAP